jgi:DNA-binding NarL/FixJ family response regulator
MPATISVLVVDDHELVRRGICSILASDPTLVVVCQTADGEEAVKKAEDLQPDIILLDISLPGISGVEAARGIRKISPASRIIFISQHDTLQMAKQAFSTGAHGYVAKIDAALDVLNAIRTVREGERFVSQRLLSLGWQPGA